jgi:hypothetical protein
MTRAAFSALVFFTLNIYCGSTGTAIAANVVKKNVPPYHVTLGTADTLRDIAQREGVAIGVEAVLPGRVLSSRSR